MDIEVIKNELENYDSMELSVGTEDSSEIINIFQSGHNWNISYGARDVLVFYQLQDVIDFLEFLKNIGVEMEL